MIVKNPNDYTLKGFRLSKTKGKKIDAVLENKKTRSILYVPFGQKGSETYKNETGVWVDRIHNDVQRRKAYLARHKGEDRNRFSSGWFSIKYLW